jgi:flagellum-specific ATP synthase
MFSVLVDGDDHNDPVADSIRGILDGHIVLKRAIAEQGRYPAVDPLASISRLAHHAWTPDQKKLVLLLRALIARYEDSRDLRAMGGYQPGSDIELDRALVIVPKLYQALTQSGPQLNNTDPFAELAEHLAETKQS